MRGAIFFIALSIKLSPQKELTPHWEYDSLASEQATELRKQLSALCSRKCFDTMKKNCYLLCALAAASLACAEAETPTTVTLHDVVFQAVTVHSGLQNQSPASSHFYIPGEFTTEGNLGVAATPNTLQGLYMEANSGLKLNGNSGTVTVSHLYLAPTIKVQGAVTNTTINKGEVSWGSSSSTPTFSLSNAAGSWLDINANYGSNITTASMSGGTVYLNELGHLNSTLSTGNTLVASAVTEQAVLQGNTALFQISEVAGTDYTLITRTLMTGDFSSWDAAALESVQLEGYTYSADLATATGYTTEDLSKYFVTANSNGLSVSYLVPEPTSTALSLLALASLAARRRRK